MALKQTKEAKRKLNNLRASYSYYRKFPTKKAKDKLIEIEKEIKVILADKRSYIRPKRVFQGKIKEIRSIKTQIWLIDNRFPHRQERRHYLKNKLDQLLNAG